jgi:hypothetical protein
MGSINAENKELVDKQTTAIDTEEALIDPKKNIQCSVTSDPTPRRPKKSVFFIENISFL